MGEPHPVDQTPAAPGGSAPSRRLDLLREAAVLALCLALAVWATWPLSPSLSVGLPCGTETVATVPLLNAWTFWWNADRAGHLFQGYWDAPIFHPAVAALAFSEPQPTSLAVAPVIWGSETPVPAYNVYLLVSLTLNGWAAWRLLRRVGLSAIPALAGGAMVEMLPVVHWQLGVIQLVPLFGMIWTIQALLDFGEKPGWTTSLRLGGAFALTYALCNHHGLFFSVLLLLSGPWLAWWQALRWRAWLWLLPGAVLCLALIGPIVVVQLRVFAERESWKRDEGWQQSLSAVASDYTRSPWDELLPLPAVDTPDRAGWRLSPGYLKMILAALGFAWGLAAARARWWTMFCVTMIAAAFFLSLGPAFTVFGWSPFRALVRFYPGFEQIRNVFRFAYWVQLGVALLAAAGVQGLARVLTRALPWVAGLMLRGAWPHRVGRALAWLVALAAGTIAAIEVVPEPQRLYFPPSVERNYGWTDWIRLHTEPDAVLACVPFPPGTDVADYFDTALWMYWQTIHERPMINGYSGFFPQAFLDLAAAMAWFPDETSLEMLHELGAEYVVVRREYASREWIQSYVEFARKLRWVYGDDKAGIDIYRLQWYPLPDDDGI